MKRNIKERGKKDKKVGSDILHSSYKYEYVLISLSKVTYYSSLYNPHCLIIKTINYNLFHFYAKNS